MPTAGFETSIPATERPRTHALDRAATEIGDITVFLSKMTIFVYVCVCVCVCVLINILHNWNYWL